MEKNLFKKEERLCNKSLLTQLYQRGSSFLLYPFRVTFIAIPTRSVPAQVVISVPKKRFKRAVDRNVLKRRIREAYRISKNEALYPALNVQKHTLLIALQYVGKEIEPYAFILTKIKQVIKRLEVVYAEVYLGDDH